MVAAGEGFFVSEPNYEIQWRGLPCGAIGLFNRFQSF